MSWARIAVRRVAKLGIAAAELTRRPAAGPRILIYHQVGAGLGREMEVTIRAFREHVEIFEKRRVVPLEAAVEDPSDHAVVVTFDDGYRDMYEHAYPLLAECGIPFVLYLATESIETGEPIGPEVGAEPLTWDQIATMMESELVTIGAHTHTHLDLRGVSSDRVDHEIGTSNSLIEQRLGVRARHFAYPWGYWSVGAHERVVQTYETATLGGGLDPGESTDPHILNRVPVQLSDGVIGLRSKLRTGGAIEEKLRRRATGYAGP